VKAKVNCRMRAKEAPIESISLQPQGYKGLSEGIAGAVIRRDFVPPIIVSCEALSPQCVGLHEGVCYK